MPFFNPGQNTDEARHETDLTAECTMKLDMRLMSLPSVP